MLGPLESSKPLQLRFVRSLSVLNDSATMISRVERRLFSIHGPGLRYHCDYDRDACNSIRDSCSTCFALKCELQRKVHSIFAACTSAKGENGEHL